MFVHEDYIDPAMSGAFRIKSQLNLKDLNQAKDIPVVLPSTPRHSNS